MSRARRIEDHMVCRLDRQRGRLAGRDRRLAHAARLKTMATEAVRTAAEAHGPGDEPALLAAIVVAASERLAGLAGPVHAATTLARQAHHLFPTAATTDPRDQAEALFSPS